MMKNHFFQRTAGVLFAFALLSSPLQAESPLSVSDLPSSPYGLPDFTDMIEKYGPAVVNISTTTKRSKENKKEDLSEDMPDIPEDSPFYEFFRRFFEGQDWDFQFKNDPSTSLGSGFIISEDGYMISNNHVVEGATEIIVRLSDRREFEAKIVGADKRSDIALLKVEANGLPTVKLGSAKDLKVGEWVLAIGSPFGFEYSATAGIVSAKGRSLPGDNYVPFIQTDVAINPGNSGGPLFNMKGEVIGVNSQIYSRTGGFMGLSFAVPVDTMLTVVEQLKSSGKVVRGWLGVLIQDVTKDLAESFGMEKPRGALVSKVLADGPAKAAGLQPGDIILKFNGKEIDHSSDLPPIVGATAVDSEAPVEVLRNGKHVNLKVLIGELPHDDDIESAISSGGGSINNSRLGLSVKNLDEKEREALKVSEGGVLVNQVEVDSPAQEAEIQKGDVILKIDGIDIKDMQHFKEIVDGLKAGSFVPILVQRQGAPVFFALKMPTEDK
jgi:serine protease Do